MSPEIFRSLYHQRDILFTPTGHIPVSPTDAQTLMSDLHQNNGVHLDMRKLLQVFQDMYWTPNTTKLAQQTIHQCHACSLGKETTRTAGPIGRHRSTQPWQLVTLDAMGLLAPHKGYKYVITFVNTYSHFIIAIPTKEHTTAAVAHVMMTHVFPHFDIVSHPPL